MQPPVKTTSLPFIDQMLERLAEHEYYCFLDGYSGYNQIPIAVEDQEKTTFTCPFGTFAMPFGLCNAPATFQRFMLSLFSNMVERFLNISWMTSPSTEIHLNNVFIILSCSAKMQGKEPNSELGEMSLHGETGDCLRLIGSEKCIFIIIFTITFSYLFI